MNRRRFLGQTGAAAAGLALTGCSTQSRRSGEGWYKISLAEWSLHRTIFSKTLDHLDFPVVAKREYGIDAVEYVNQFWMDKAKDQNYLRDLKSRCEGEGVRSLLIMCDNEGKLGDADQNKRRQAVENHYKWIEAAKFLGCHSIRVNAESQGNYHEQLNRVADGLRRLTEFGAQHGIMVIVENHGGFSSSGKWLSEVMQKVNHPQCGTLPDFGNWTLGERFGVEYDRYKGVKELMPYAKAVSAKSNEFDPAGNEVRTDYYRMMYIVTEAGYHGYVGVEYEGVRLSEPEGIRATKQLLEKVRQKMG